MADKQKPLGAVFLAAIYDDLDDLYEEMAKSHPSLERGQVWCTVCGHTEKVNSGTALQSGWPTCCGYTMTIDSPDERAALALRDMGEKPKFL